MDGNKFCLDNTYLFIQRWLEINSTTFRVISIYIWIIRLILVYFYDKFNFIRIHRDFNVYKNMEEDNMRSKQLQVGWNSLGIGVKTHSTEAFEATEFDLAGSRELTVGQQRENGSWPTHNRPMDRRNSFSFP